MEKYLDEEYRGYQITVYYDPNPESPRGWSNLANIVCFGNYKYVGDKHSYSCYLDLLEALCKRYIPEFWEDTDFYDCDIQEVVDELSDYVLIRPVSCYEHSGMTIWVGSPNDRWDSGYIGVVYQTKDNTMQNQCAKCDSWKEIAEKNMIAEVEVLDTYIRGEVYGYAIEDEDGVDIDSCWGYYGEDGVEDAVLQAKSIIDQHIKEKVVGSNREPMLFSYEEMTQMIVAI